MFQRVLRGVRRKVFLVAGIAGGVGLCVYLVKENFTGGPKYEIREDLNDVVAIVTGATSGLGLATAEQLAKKKARVIMACRDIEKCKESRRKIVLNTRNRSVVCRQCDLSSMESIKAFAARMLKDEKKINLLVNNAAVKQTDIRKVTDDGFETHLGTNCLGHFLLTMLLLDKLKESGPSRIVNVVDVIYKSAHIDFDNLNSDDSYDRKVAYGQSKLCQMAFSNELANQLKGTDITVNAVYPGVCYTDLDRRERYTHNYLFYPYRYLSTRTAKQGANGILYAGTSPDVASATGEYLFNCEVREQSGEALDQKLRLRLWLTADKWTRFKEAKADVMARVAKAVAAEQVAK